MISSQQQQQHQQPHLSLAPQHNSQSSKVREQLIKISNAFRLLRNSAYDPVNRSQQQQQHNSSSDDTGDNDMQLSLQRLCDDLIQLFLSLPAVQQQQQHPNGGPHTDVDMVLQQSDMIVQIVEFVSELSKSLTEDPAECNKVNSSSSNLKHEAILIKNAQLITCFAEKSPISFGSETLNKLVSHLLQISTRHVAHKAAALRANCGSQSVAASLSECSYEINRALGSLLYQNGARLADANLSELFGSGGPNGGGAGLLPHMRHALDTMDAKTMLSLHGGHELISHDLLNRHQLLLAQLLFNLTMPCRPMATTAAEQLAASAVLPSPSAFIADKYKIKCVYLIVRTLRRVPVGSDGAAVVALAPQVSDSLSKAFSKQFNGSGHATARWTTGGGDQTAAASDYKDVTGRILCKALQGLENLFMSVQSAALAEAAAAAAASSASANNAGSNASSSSTSNWLHSLAPSQCQLGDILAVVKELTLFGIRAQSSSSLSSLSSSSQRISSSLSATQSSRQSSSSLANNMSSVVANESLTSGEIKLQPASLDETLLLAIEKSNSARASNNNNSNNLCHDDDETNGGGGDQRDDDINYGNVRARRNVVVNGGEFVSGVNKKAPASAATASNSAANRNNKYKRYSKSGNNNNNSNSGKFNNMSGASSNSTGGGSSGGSGGGAFAHQEHHSTYSNSGNSSNNNGVAVSAQCLREVQVPLIQYRTSPLANELKDSQQSDSDQSTDSSHSSSTSAHNFYIEKCNAKVRVAAVAVLLTAFQSLDKRTLLSYWDSFLGVSNSGNMIGNSGSTCGCLSWSARNDHSPKVRLIAASALAIYLECVRAFFTIAASEQEATTPAAGASGSSAGPSNNNSSSSSSFLPVSRTIAALIRQLHKELLHALLQRETFALNQIQLVRCVQHLVRATPYQKLKPGLIYRLVTGLSGLLCAKSTGSRPTHASSREAAALAHETLACLQSILITHHQIAEVHLALLAPVARLLDAGSTGGPTSSRSQYVPASTAAAAPTSAILDATAMPARLEQLATSYKVPNISQSRVTYFYDGVASYTVGSSLGSSACASGQRTPTPHHLSALIGDMFLANGAGAGAGDHTASSAFSGNTSFLVEFCIRTANMSLVSASAAGTADSSGGIPLALHLNGAALDLLHVICRKYFELFANATYFANLSQMIVDNVEIATTTATSTTAAAPATATATATAAAATTSSGGPAVTLVSLSDNFMEHGKLKTLKLLEELARCLATSELRALAGGIDLSACSAFWSTLLHSKLVGELLCDEQRYLLSSSACDCLASIGADIFELLPYQKRIYCLTSLLHLTRSQSSLIRSASVRALGVYVTFASLKEDHTFLADLSVNLAALLASDANNLVRQKAAWSLSNLSEVLVENGDKLGRAFTGDYALTLWLRLVDTASGACQRESDKLKSYLVRTLGNLVHYASLIEATAWHDQLYAISCGGGAAADDAAAAAAAATAAATAARCCNGLDEQQQMTLRLVERSVTRAIDALCACRHVKMLKVKWNLSHAIGIAMRHFNTWPLQTRNPAWLRTLYDTLLELFTQSSNFKVRINACVAMMTINLNQKNLTRIDVVVGGGGGGGGASTLPQQQQAPSIYLRLWISLFDNFSKLSGEMPLGANDSTNEVQHKTTLIHQLCKLFTYLCKFLRLDDLESLTFKCLNGLKTAAATPTLTFAPKSWLRPAAPAAVPKATATFTNLTVGQLKSYLTGYVRHIFQHIDTSKQEVQFYNEALTQLNLLGSSKRTSVEEDCLMLLTSVLLQRVAAGRSAGSVTASRLDSDSSVEGAGSVSTGDDAETAAGATNPPSELKNNEDDEPDMAHADPTRPQHQRPRDPNHFPFKQTYD